MNREKTKQDGQYNLKGDACKAALLPSSHKENCGCRNGCNSALGVINSVATEMKSQRRVLDWVNENSNRSQVTF